MLDELELVVIMVVLLKKNFILKGVLEKVRDVCSCKIRIYFFLILVEEGSFDCVEEFLFIFKKFGYLEIVKLIDLESVDNKVGKICWIVLLFFNVDICI